MIYWHNGLVCKIEAEVHCAHKMLVELCFFHQHRFNVLWAQWTPSSKFADQSIVPIEGWWTYTGGKSIVLPIFYGYNGLAWKIEEGVDCACKMKMLVDLCRWEKQSSINILRTQWTGLQIWGKGSLANLCRWKTEFHQHFKGTMDWSSKLRKGSIVPRNK